MLYTHWFLTTSFYIAATAVSAAALLAAGVALLAAFSKKGARKKTSAKAARILLAVAAAAMFAKSLSAWVSCARELSGAEYIVCAPKMRLAAKQFAADIEKKRVCVNGESVFYNGGYKEIWSVKRRRYLDPDEIQRISNGRVFDDARTKYKWSDDPLSGGS